MFRWRQFLRWILPSALLATVAWADWGDRMWGTAVLQHFSPRDMGIIGGVGAIAQHPDTHVFYFGTSTGLVSFDGNSWTPLHNGDPVLQLAFDRAGKLWFGSMDDVGYFELGTNAAKPISLREKLPVDQTQGGAVWGIFPSETCTYVVTANKLLRWDGTRFKSWSYATKQRLFPILFEGRLWFHHLESGLYRVDEDGPQKIHEPPELPDKGLFWLERRDGLLVGASNRGFRSISATPQSFATPELDAFLTERRLTGVIPLTPGFRAVFALGYGIAIVDRNGAIVRKIPLPPNTQNPFLDRDGYLWTCNFSGLFRFEQKGAIARVPLPTAGLDTKVSSINVSEDGDVWIVAANRVFRIRAGHDAETVEAIYQSATTIMSVCPLSNGQALLAEFGSLRLLSGPHPEARLEIAGTQPTRIFPLRAAGTFIVAHEQGHARLSRDASGHWRTNEQALSLGRTQMLADDEDGNIWLASYWDPPRKLERTADGLRPAPGATDIRGLDQAPSVVVRRKHDVLGIANRSVFIARAKENPHLIGTLPGPVLDIALSPDERHLYAAFFRSAAPTAYEIGIAAFEISAAGTVEHQRDLIVPDMGLIGRITSMAVTAERGSDTLWIGGEDGLMQARPAELSEWKPPSPVRIELTTRGAEGTVFAYASRPQFLIESPDIALRPALRFQSSLTQGEPDWSPPSDTTTFAFPNLSEGNYTFSVRSVNAAGLASAPTYFQFSVLPPWYRSAWAYATYAALAVAALLGAIRVRERRIRARNLELERLVAERTAELVKANAAKDDFLASMSHEIRNPMNGVVGLSAAIDISHLDEEGRYRFGLLRHCATHLASLLEDILDFSKLQAGTIELDPQPFSPAELLDAVSAITSPVSAAAGVKVEFALGPSVPPRLIGDARRIRQVLLNYVSNAIKYAPQGDIDVTVWARTVGETNAVLTFAVSDAGPGIPADEQERIFEKFERGAGARSNRIPGTGMGLAVCRRLATKMGGNAWVESAPGEGATFYLSLELPIAAPAAIDTAAQTIADLPKLALIVDDEDYNLVTLATMLERRGFQVLRATTATGALAALAQNPDVVFLDYDMPDTTGPELAKRIRQATLRRQPLIIATTAYSTVEKRRECLASGMDGFLSKPIVEERLGTALADAVHARSPGNARHLVLPSRDSFDPLENLQTLARQHAQTLEAELAEFTTAARGEFEELHAGVATADGPRAARAAHKLAGRFGFLHAAAAMKRALQLERLCQQRNWNAARPLATELTQDWTTLHDTLARLSCESA